ncbi:hypothetical protein AVEN_12919-1 [Araneus ventricosus]|uniref:Uncharacterized protein n=1 Tax=Araneus ventricosus TaxID=182803 RepID=A0A4Y2IVF9_ARAVE|nr:hypothetical protein AVEN_12919-1 [Araneus ventricosus]
MNDGPPRIHRTLWPPHNSPHYERLMRRPPFYRGTTRHQRWALRAAPPLLYNCMQKEEYEEWMSIDEDIPLAATITDLKICQAVCEQDQAIKVDDSDGNECVEENPPTNS